MPNKGEPTILIIFGISGDLSRRYLLPAIEAIHQASMLPEDFRIVGITRKTGLSAEDLCRASGDLKFVGQNLELHRLDAEKEGDCRKLEEVLDGIEKSFGQPAQRIFYLSVPPEACKGIVECIGKAGLPKRGKSKLLLEKPFGKDYASAKDLIEHIEKYFKPEEVYRIDHYLAKEAAQNIIVFRDGNSLFKKTWNNEFIENIEVTASEELGIENRAHFYEQTGALRDYVPSHLLQLLSLVLMDLPPKCDLSEVSSCRQDTLKHLKVARAARGQYEGYRQEVGNEKSNVETFVSVQLESDDPKWHGVPMALTHGKALRDRFTEIKIRYKKSEEHESNELLLRLQPDAGIKFSVWAKKPGYGRELSQHVLSFHFKDHYEKLPEAYEQVLYSAFNSDHSLFASSEEILESWRIVGPIQEEWKKPTDDLLIYKKGSTVEEIIGLAKSRE